MVGARNRRRNEIIGLWVSMAGNYRLRYQHAPQRQRHRNHEELEQELLNFLHRQGPTYLNKCILFLETNDREIKKIVLHLLSHGFVKKTDIQRRKGRMRPKFMKAVGAIDMMPNRAISVVNITPLGVKYVETMNKRAKLLRWER